MKRVIATLILTTIILLAYDFGNIPQVRVKDIKIDRAMMLMIGKTHCIWCESMAPQLKEIKEEYPKTIIYYINSDKEPLWAINHNIVELPVQIFYNRDGKEIGRHIGYIGKDNLLELLKESGVLAE